MATRDDRGRIVYRLVDLADNQSMIERRTFENVVLLGPAVLAPLESITIDGCSFDGDPESLFIEVPDGRQGIGFIGVRETTFRTCEFHNVALAGTAESIKVMKAGFGLAQGHPAVPPPAHAQPPTD